MPSLAEIVARAEQIVAGKGRDVHNNPVTDSGMTAEALYPHALRFCIERDLKNGGKAQEYAREIDLELISGVAALPLEVMREFLDMAYLIGRPHSSYSRSSDYERSQFSALLDYYAIRDGSLLFSGQFPNIISQPVCTVSTLNANLTGSGAPALDTPSIVGHRLYLVDAVSGTLCFNGIVNAVTSHTDGTLAGRPIASTAGSTGTVYSTSDDVAVRQFNDVHTTAGSSTVTSASAQFTSADVGRRLRVYRAGLSPALSVDAIILTVVSSTQVTLAAKADTTETVGEGTILYSALKLHAPALPALPTDAISDIVMSKKLADDCIAVIAAALAGELPLAQLIV